MKIIDRYFQELKATIDQIPTDRVEEIVELLHNARLNRNQVIIMGNGGSASTASHFVCDLAKNTRKSDLPGFRALGLTDNMAILTAYANDEGYANVFAQQLSNLVLPGDVVIAISCSGNSPNVLAAVELAKKMGAITVGFTGLTGGKLKDMTHFGVHVPSDRMAQVEDIHLMLEHIICLSLHDKESQEIVPQVSTVAARGYSADTDGLVKNLFSKTLPMTQKSGAFAKPDGSPTNQELLSKISMEFAAKLDLHDLLSRVLSITVESVGAVGGSIVVLDEDGEVVEGAMAYGGQIQSQPTDQLNDTVQHGLAGWVLEHRRAALVENTKEDPRWLPRGWEATLDLSRSAICVPLLTHDRVFGVLTLTRLQSNRFTMEDLALLTSVTLALSYSFTSKSGAAKKY